MNQYVKAVYGGVSAGGAAFLGAYGVRPLAEVIVLTIVGTVAGAALVWGATNTPAEPKA